MYLIVLFLFIPVRYAELATTDKNLAMQKVILICALFSIVPTSSVHDRRQHHLMVQSFEFVCALLSICCMMLLGFADDVLNLQWRCGDSLHGVSCAGTS